VDSTGDGRNLGSATQCNDGTNHCTLRAAIEAANSHPGDDAISFDIPTTDPGFNSTTGVFTITFTSPLPDLSTNLSIDGPGAGKLTVHANATGSNNFRVFNVTLAGTVSFSDITISGGLFNSGGSGAGIQNANTATVNITNCVVANNFALGGGGGISIISGTVNVSRTTFDSNGTTGGGAAIANGSGTLNTTDCTFTANSAGGGGALGAISNNTGNTTITNCTFSSNSSGRGGALVSFGSGIVTVNNSTFTGNSATLGGGGAIASLGGTTNLNNCTIIGNMAVNSPDGGAGGISNLGSGTINIRSTLVALNSATGFSVSQDVSGPFVSQGFNLIGKTNGSTGFPAATDFTGTEAAPLDPKVDPNGLQNNGGPTRTVALLFGSPAIDKGTRTGLPVNLIADQRGIGFARTFNDPAVPNAPGGDATDIGAFEVQSAAPPPTPTPTATPTATPTSTPIATPSATPTSTPTATPSATPTTTPAATPTVTPSATPTSTPTATPSSGNLGNISTRLQVGTGNNVLFAGFIVQGSASKTVLIRSAGPSLTAFGVPGALGNPQLELHNASNTIGTNDNWQTTQIGGVITSDQVAAIQNSGAAPTNPAEPAIIATLPAGGYTAIVQGVGGTQGVATVEVYDLTPNNGAVLANISTRGLIQTGDNVMIGGFIVTAQPSKVIVIAVGPSLIPFGINNALTNPQLELHDANGRLAGNDNWQTTQLGGIIMSEQSAAIQNSGVAPSNPAESAIIATLAPGSYTAIAQGVNGGTGVGVIEVFALP
jgi:hypothetical protein